MDTLTVAIFLAVFTEWITERLAGGWLKGNTIRYAAAVVGLALGVGFRIDLLESLGLPLVPFLSYIISGLIISGGANVVHEFKKYLVKP